MKASTVVDVVLISMSIVLVVFCGLVMYDCYGTPVYTKTVKIQDKVVMCDSNMKVLGCDGTTYWATHWEIYSQLQPGHTYSLQVRDHIILAFGNPSIESINNAEPAEICK